MKKTFILSITLLATVCAVIPGQAQSNRTKVHASSNYITKDIEGLGTFDIIELIGSPDVEYRQSADGTCSIQAYGSDNVLEYLEVKVRGGKLTVKYKDGVQVSGKPKTRVIASSPSLEEAKVTGSGDIHLYGIVKGDELTLSVIGSGDIDANALDFRNITLTVAGSGDIEVNDIMKPNMLKALVSGSGDIGLKGNAWEAEYAVAGSGDISAWQIDAVNVKATISGSGDISCKASGVLDASVAGSGSVAYSGEPSVLNIHGKKGSVGRK